MKLKAEVDEQDEPKEEKKSSGTKVINSDKKEVSQSVKGMNKKKEEEMYIRESRCKQGSVVSERDVSERRQKGQERDETV